MVFVWLINSYKIDIYLSKIILILIMLNSLKIAFNFGAKNYSSTFKLRARLAEFFKHVHPDQLNQAPVHKP